MQIRFWGTRGSIPTPGPNTIRYGGNTSCLEMRTNSGTLIILDCGTGLRSLGENLMAQDSGPVRGYILITHTHWDHIQGLPFFAPLFQPGNEWDIYAPRGLQQSLRETLSGQMQYTYFPVTFEQLGSTIRYHELVEGEFTIDDVRIKTQYLNHTAVTLGYRISTDGVVVVYSTDHEPHSQHMVIQGTIGDQDQHHADFLADADLVIHDAQYIASEYEVKRGWGHSTVEYDVEMCRHANVKRLALTHHDPLRDDDSIDRMIGETRNYLKGKEIPMEVFAAAEGQVVDLKAQPHEKAEIISELSALAPDQSAIVNKSVLIGVTDPILESLLLKAVEANGIHAIIKTDRESLLQAVRTEQPSLIILDNTSPSKEGLTICQEIRHNNTYESELPIIIVTNKEEDLLASKEEGVTDWLLEPFSALYARTRIHAWLLRVACRWIRAPVPQDEERRMSVLRWLKILDTAPEERFDRITRLASALFDMPLVTVTFLAEDRQWFKSCLGISDVRETSREVSFCAHAIAGRKLMIIPDAHMDDRFADNPLVTGEPHIRFYAGQPLILNDGTCIGTLCIMDTRPRLLNEKDMNLLKDLSELVIQELLVPVESK